MTAEEAIAEFWRQFRAAMDISPESWECSLNEQTDEQNAAFSRALNVLAPWDAPGDKQTVKS